MVLDERFDRELWITDIFACKLFDIFGSSQLSEELIHEQGFKVIGPRDEIRFASHFH